MPELAIIVPTRGRPENVRKVIAAWDFTNAWEVADLVLATDGDDPEIKRYWSIVVGLEHFKAGDLRTIELPVWMPMVHKLNAVAMILSDEGSHFAIGFAGDDHLPQTIGWAQTYLRELHALKTGMVYGDDGYQGKKLCTEWAMTADVVRTLGRMVPAPVEHMYCDNSVLDLFTGAGAVTHLPGVRIEHFNPYAGQKAPMDEQYKRVNSREQFKRDKASYDKWRNGQMSEDVAAVKALQPNRKAPPRQRKEVRKVGVKSPFPYWFKQIVGVTPEDIGITLADFAIQVPADQEIVELGVYHGKTALQMAWGARQGNGAHVTAIDPWELSGNVYGDTMGDLDAARRWARYWVQSLGYSDHIELIQAFSYQVADSWSTEETYSRPSKSVGLLFIDGDHTEEGARRDIESWAPHLAPGAVIAIDDYVNENYPGVAAAVDALVAEGVLAPVQVYHDRLAVTGLTSMMANLDAIQELTGGKEGTEPEITAITSEGVSPSPFPPDLDAALRTALELPEDPKPTAETHPRMFVGEDEIPPVAAGTFIDDLNLGQLRALARKRGIVLGRRKDLREQVLDALADGK